MQGKHKKLKICVGIILGAILICSLSMVIVNSFNSHYTELNETDQLILKELDEYYEHTKTKDTWEDFNLGEKTILAMDGSFGKAYLINPANEIRSIFAKKIEMPSYYSITVYRISPIATQLFQCRFDGNFNTDGKVYQLYGNEVYYTKYDDSDSVANQFTSKHYMTFLSHEAFHYYMQNNWADGAVYSTDMMSQEDKELLFKEYEVLDKIQKALQGTNDSKEVFLQYAGEYTDIVSQRIEKNPDYVKQELERETIEGTASYVGIKSSEIVGYDYGVMYFDNIKNVSFSEIMPNVESGSFEEGFLADRIPYESGALLCLLMDALEIPNWQEAFNSQTKDHQVTLYSIISDFVNIYKGDKADQDSMDIERN